MENVRLCNIQITCLRLPRLAILHIKYFLESAISIIFFDHKSLLPRFYCAFICAPWKTPRYGYRWNLKVYYSKWSTRVIGFNLNRNCSIKMITSVARYSAGFICHICQNSELSVSLLPLLTCWFFFKSTLFVSASVDGKDLKGSFRDGVRLRFVPGQVHFVFLQFRRFREYRNIS